MISSGGRVSREAGVEVGVEWVREEEGVVWVEEEGAVEEGVEEEEEGEEDGMSQRTREVRDPEERGVTA